MKRVITLLAIALLFSSLSFAQDKKEDIKELFEIMKTTEMIDKMTSSSMQMAQHQLKQMGGEDSDGQNMENMDEVMKEINMTTHKMVQEEMVGLYDEHFTHEEIKDMKEFYKSDTGKKYIEKSPVIQRELMGTMMNEYMPELKEKLKKAMDSGNE